MATEDFKQQAADAAAKAKDFVTDNAEKVGDFVEEHADKVEAALKSDKAEEISDKVLDGIAGFAKKIAGDEHAAKIDEVRAKIDGEVGNDS